MRCKLCCRFYNRNFQLCKNDKQLAAIYDANFKEQLTSRRAFIIRSRVARNSDISSWIRKELHAISSEDNSLKHKTQPDAWQTTHERQRCTRTDGSLKGMANRPRVLHTDTRADMNPVATSTQEHHHCHLLAIRRCITCPPCSSTAATSKPLRFVKSGR